MSWVKHHFAFVQVYSESVCLEHISPDDSCSSTEKPSLAAGSPLSLLSEHQDTLLTPSCPLPLQSSSPHLSPLVLSGHQHSLLSQPGPSSQTLSPEISNQVTEKSIIDFTVEDPSYV